jgi:hypothetical protein
MEQPSVERPRHADPVEQQTLNRYRPARGVGGFEFRRSVELVDELADRAVDKAFVELGARWPPRSVTRCRPGSGTR